MKPTTKTNRTFRPAAALAPALLLALAALAASAGDPAAGPVVTDAQFDQALTAAAAQTQGAAFTTPLRSVAPRFREVPTASEPGKPLWHKLMLNTRGKKLDAIRFRVPEGEARGMAWAFIPPANLAGWYIIPTTGEMEGFEKFFRPDARKILGAKAPEGAKQVLLQSLGAANLKPGGEYLLWFRFRDEKPAPLYVTIALPPAAAVDTDKLDEARIVKTLGLTREGTDLGATDLDPPGKERT
jgi:hypothetical protein